MWTGRQAVAIWHARKLYRGIFFVALMATLAFPLHAADPHAPVHGLWVWRTLTALKASGSAEALRDFCRSEGIDEVYVSVAELNGTTESQYADLIEKLHLASIRVEALMGSRDADEPGPPREKLLNAVREILRFDQRTRAEGFDGIHLDIEPQQRRENQGPLNLGFLPGLVESYRAVRQLADPVHLPVDADIPIKVLKGDLSQRQLLLSALPRFTLMLYELSSPDDGEGPERKAEKLRAASSRYLQAAYQGLPGPDLGQMSIGLRTSDYGALLPRMLQTLDEANGANPHYFGWARHSYNDTVKANP